MKFELQTLRDNIVSLCRIKNVTVNKMLKDCGLEKSLICNMKKGAVPAVDKVFKVAEYFGVTVDELLTEHMIE